MTGQDDFTVWVVQHWPTGPEWERRPADHASGERWPDAHRKLLRRFGSLPEAIEHCLEGAHELVRAIEAPQDAWWGVQHQGVIVCNVVYSRMTLDLLEPKDWDLSHWTVYAVGELDGGIWSDPAEPLVIFDPRWAAKNWSWVLRWRTETPSVRFEPAYRYGYEAMEADIDIREGRDARYWCLDHDPSTSAGASNEPSGSADEGPAEPVLAIEPDPERCRPETEPDEAARRLYADLEGRYGKLTSELEKVRQSGYRLTLSERKWGVADTKLRWLASIGDAEAFVATDRDDYRGDDLDEACLQLESAYLEGLADLEAGTGEALEFAAFLENADALALRSWLDMNSTVGDSARSKLDAYWSRRDALQREIDETWKLMKENYAP